MILFCPSPHSTLLLRCSLPLHLPFTLFSICAFYTHGYVTSDSLFRFYIVVVIVPEQTLFYYVVHFTIATFVVCCCLLPHFPPQYFYVLTILHVCSPLSFYYFVADGCLGREQVPVYVCISFCCCCSLYGGWVNHFRVFVDPILHYWVAWALVVFIPLTFTILLFPISHTPHICCCWCCNLLPVVYLTPHCTLPSFRSARYRSLHSFPLSVIPLFTHGALHLFVPIAVRSFGSFRRAFGNGRHSLIHIRVVTRDLTSLHFVVTLRWLFTLFPYRWSTLPLVVHICWFYYLTDHVARCSHAVISFTIPRFVATHCSLTSLRSFYVRFVRLFVRSGTERGIHILRLLFTLLLLFVTSFCSTPPFTWRCRYCHGYVAFRSDPHFTSSSPLHTSFTPSFVYVLLYTPRTFTVYIRLPRAFVAIRFAFASLHSPIDFHLHLLTFTLPSLMLCIWYEFCPFSSPPRSLPFCYPVGGPFIMRIPLPFALICCIYPLVSLLFVWGTERWICCFLGASLFTFAVYTFTSLFTHSLHYTHIPPHFTTSFVLHSHICCVVVVLSFPSHTYICCPIPIYLNLFPFPTLLHLLFHLLPHFHLTLHILHICCWHTFVCCCYLFCLFTFVVILPWPFLYLFICYSVTFITSVHGYLQWARERWTVGEMGINLFVVVDPHFLIPSLHFQSYITLSIYLFTFLHCCTLYLFILCYYCILPLPYSFEFIVFPYSFICPYFVFIFIQFVTFKLFIPTREGSPPPYPRWAGDGVGGPILTFSPAHIHRCSPHFICPPHHFASLGIPSFYITFTSLLFTVVVFVVDSCVHSFLHLFWPPHTLLFHFTPCIPLLFTFIPSRYSFVCISPLHFIPRWSRQWWWAIHCTFTLLLSLNSLFIYFSAFVGWWWVFVHSLLVQFSPFMLFTFPSTHSLLLLLILLHLPSFVWGLHTIWIYVWSPFYGWFVCCVHYPVCLSFYIFVVHFVRGHSLRYAHFTLLSILHAFTHHIYFLISSTHTFVVDICCSLILRCLLLRYYITSFGDYTSRVPCRTFHTHIFIVIHPHFGVYFPIAPTHTPLSFTCCTHHIIYICPYLLLICCCYLTLPRCCCWSCVDVGRAFWPLISLLCAHYPTPVLFPLSLPLFCCYSFSLLLHYLFIVIIYIYLIPIPQPFIITLCIVIVVVDVIYLLIGHLLYLFKSFRHSVDGGDHIPMLFGECRCVFIICVIVHSLLFVTLLLTLIVGSLVPITHLLYPTYIPLFIWWVVVVLCVVMVVFCCWWVGHLFIYLMTSQSTLLMFIALQSHSLVIPICYSFIVIYSCDPIVLLCGDAPDRWASLMPSLYSATHLLTIYHSPHCIPLPWPLYSPHLLYCVLLFMPYLYCIVLLSLLLVMWWPIATLLTLLFPLSSLLRYVRFSFGWVWLGSLLTLHVSFHVLFFTFCTARRSFTRIVVSHYHFVDCSFIWIHTHHARSRVLFYRVFTILRHFTHTHLVLPWMDGRIFTHHLPSRCCLRLLSVFYTLHFGCCLHAIHLPSSSARCCFVHTHTHYTLFCTRFTHTPRFCYVVTVDPSERSFTLRFTPSVVCTFVTRLLRFVPSLRLRLRCLRFVRSYTHTHIITFFVVVDLLFIPLLLSTFTLSPGPVVVRSPYRSLFHLLFYIYIWSTHITHLHYTYIIIRCSFPLSCWEVNSFSGNIGGTLFVPDESGVILIFDICICCICIVVVDRPLFPVIPFIYEWWVGRFLPICCALSDIYIPRFPHTLHHALTFPLRFTFTRPHIASVLRTFLLLLHSPTFPLIYFDYIAGISLIFYLHSCTLSTHCTHLFY